MPLLYNFDIDTPDELLAILANNLQKRRLEKGLSRKALTELDFRSDRVLLLVHYPPVLNKT